MSPQELVVECLRVIEHEMPARADRLARYQVYADVMLMSDFHAADLGVSPDQFRSAVRWIQYHGEQAARGLEEVPPGGCHVLCDYPIRGHSKDCRVDETSK